MLKTKDNGITMVVLVITIIILLILAGVSISALTNQGLFGKAKEAKEKSKEAQLQENSILDSYEKAINDVSVGNVKDNKDEEKKDSVGGVDEEQVKKIVQEELAKISIDEEKIRKIAKEETINVASNIQTDGIYDTLFEGTAYRSNTTYNLTKSINDYKYVIVYASISAYESSSLCVDKNYYKKSQIVGGHANDNWTYSLEFQFDTDKSFKISDVLCEGWSGTPQIYLIKGVK